MHYSTNPEEIKTDIEKLGHMVTNICNIKQYRTKQPFSMFFVELKTAPNNKDTFNLEYIQQCKIKFKPPNSKGILLNVQTAKDMRMPKIIPTSN
jgi:hypothetical protein